MKLPFFGSFFLAFSSVTAYTEKTEILSKENQ